MTLTGHTLINVRRFYQGLAGALLVVGPCIAVMGMMPGSV
jgi:hypothetical protein